MNWLFGNNSHGSPPPSATAARNAAPRQSSGMFNYPGQVHRAPSVRNPATAGSGRGRSGSASASSSFRNSSSSRRSSSGRRPPEFRPTTPSSFRSSSTTSSRLSTSTTSAASNTTTTTTNNNRDISPVRQQPSQRPGAYAVERSTASSRPQVCRVAVPEGIRPGQEFMVRAANQTVRVRCPPAVHQGQMIQVTLPPKPTTKMLTIAQLTRGGDDSDGNDATNYAFPGRRDVLGTNADGGAVPMTKEVREANSKAASNKKTETLIVTIPPGVRPGMSFYANAPNGQRFEVKCPRGAGPGTKVRFVPPTTNESKDAPASSPSAQQPKMQVYEVIVPPGVRPNQPFTLMANGQRVLVTCPPNVGPGRKIRFNLPIPKAGTMGSVQLSYKDEAGSSGWCRTIRVTDMKFQWVRVDGNDAVEDTEVFGFGKSAYVRSIKYLEGNDPRMRTGIVSLEPAKDATVASSLVDDRKNGNNKPLLTYADIATVQTKSMEEKIKWFRSSVCEKLYEPWDQGHVKIHVRRQYLLQDSVDAIMSLGRNDMRKRWRFEFIGEPGIEAGGLTREWFQLVTEQIYDPDFGLWLPSINNQMSMRINPASHVSCPDNHLIYFRFLGRVLGRALFDGQLVKGHMTRHLYKHILGWPITFEDIKAQDEDYYNSLKQFPTYNNEELSALCLDFTVSEETLGARTDVELIPDGSNTDVTSENLPQYLEAILKYRTLNRTKPQITELMLGFFDIVPEPALTVFDPNELELILCGLPTIDMKDWMDNTRYTGSYDKTGRNEKVVKWFWDVVENDFDQEMKARLLQFTTGTSGVPPRGFAVLQGNDGSVKKFCIHGVSRDTYAYPRAHTCFNRIDLPNYSSKRELRDKLRQAVTMTYVGFDIE